MANAKKTAHKSDCQMAFGRKDASCPRCQELLAGAAPRAAAYDYGAKARREAVVIAAIKTHDFTNCTRCVRGMCTCFDY